jgi:hypothetical protein
MIPFHSYLGIKGERGGGGGVQTTNVERKITLLSGCEIYIELGPSIISRVRWYDVRGSAQYSRLCIERGRLPAHPEWIYTQR